MIRMTENCSIITNFKFIVFRIYEINFTKTVYYSYMYNEHKINKTLCYEYLNSALKSNSSRLNNTLMFDENISNGQQFDLESEMRYITRREGIKTEKYGKIEEYLESKFNDIIERDVKKFINGNINKSNIITNKKILVITICDFLKALLIFTICYGPILFAIIELAILHFMVYFS